MQGQNQSIGVVPGAVSKRSLTIRTRILSAVLVFVASVIGLFSYLLYDTQKTEYMTGIDRKLLTGAIMARDLVGRDYHNRIFNEKSLTKDAYLEIVDAYNNISREAGFQYLWSNLFLDDGTVVFTSGTSTSKDVNKGDHASFFDVHTDPAAFEPVIQAGRRTYSTFENKWGQGRMVLVPFRDVHGRTYVFGASVSVDELDERLRVTAFNSLLLFSAVFAVGCVLSYVIADAISRPLQKLRRTSRGIADGNYGLQVEGVSGGAELEDLADSVNSMSDAILENYTAQQKMVRDLEEARDELRRTRDELEVRVKERTRDLRNLTQAVEQSAQMVFITDLRGRIEYVNPRFSEVTGYSKEEAVGQNPRLLRSGDTPDKVYRNLWQELIHKGVWKGELKDRCKNGRVFWASVIISRVTDEKGIPSHYVAVHEDITKRKLAEQDIHFAKEQAEMASRSKSEMLANMSHELRTPLNAIMGFSESMLHQTFGPLENDKYLEYANDIYSSGSHLLELINDILDVKPESLIFGKRRWTLRRRLQPVSDW